jgi:sugar O-acyltransferase (sialic acid O-acetyltransferase NeuD family)
MKRALIGAGGHAREVMMQMQQSLPCFVDDQYVDGNTLPLSQFNPTEYEAMVVVGDSIDRLKMVLKMPHNTRYFTFIHPTALIGNHVSIGEGSFIGANSILTTNIIIGKHALLNRANHVGHDTKIGTGFSMMPGAIVSGNCEISDFVYIGTGASIKQGIRICNNVTIGLNAGVVNNINTPGTYIGIPAKKIK